MSVATKRIYQLAKEFERDEKEIIEFLTGQGIKVANRLSAVSEDTYNLLKAKYTAPPEPEPKPEPKPAPKPAVELIAQVKPDDKPAEQTAPAQPPTPGKKKKKKKFAQPDEQQPEEPAVEFDPTDDPTISQETNESTRAIYREAISAGNEFIANYNGNLTKRERKAMKVRMTRFTDTWGILNELKFEYPDTTPVRYWQAVNKLTTRAFKLINEYGLSHRETLAELRDLVVPLGAKYEPREIFTDEENERFKEHQSFLYHIFGHGMGAVNDRLYELKYHAEKMKDKYEFMDLVDYISNPDNELRSKQRVPFVELVDSITFALSGIVRRVEFYIANKERVAKIIEVFFDWRDAYVKLKEQGAPAEKLEKYFELEQKLIDLIEFMSFDNLLYVRNKNKPTPFDTALEVLRDYRDNLDDPDAERRFKYKVRGINNVIYKPKEYIFLFRLGGLEAGKDYRSNEEIAAAIAAAEAAEAEAAAKAAAEVEAADKPAETVAETAQQDAPSANEESPANNDEA